MRARILLLACGAVCASVGCGRRGTTDHLTPRAQFAAVIVAQLEYQRTDADNNGVADFWVGDIAGLATIIGKDDTPIRLIGYNIAHCDAHPIGGNAGRVRFEDIASRRSEDDSGQWVLAVIPLDCEGRPYAQDLDGDGVPQENLSSFAICATPGPLLATEGRLTYIVDQRRTIWRKDNGGLTVGQFPKDPLAEGWVECGKLAPD